MTAAQERKRAQQQAAAASREAQRLRRAGDAEHIKGNLKAAQKLYAQATSFDRESDKWAKAAAAIRSERKPR